MKILILILILNPYIIKCFEEINLEISINEEEENGKEIIDLRKEISSLKLLNNSNGYKIKFVRPCLNIYFDEINMFIIRSLKIDREKVCPYENNCYINCNLFVEKEDIKLIKLKIKINDINDHKPKFLKKYYLFNFNKYLFKNFSFELEQAQDEDLSLNNSIENYYLNSSSSSFFPFQLYFNKQKHLLHLILIQHLETNKNYQFLFQLFVYDGNNQTDNCFIQINIFQNQNLPPLFQKSLYEFFILNQNQTFIGKVHAFHPFNNTQQIISYRFISSIDYFHLFQLNQTTGEIYLKQNQNFNFFDFFYEIFIEAFYSNYISSLTTVHIYFNFTYQNYQQDLFIQILIPKLFQKNQNQNQIFIKENSSIPLTILQLFISSTSSSLTINTSIHNQQDFFLLKQLDQQSYELILLKSFDYEFIQFIYLNFILNNYQYQTTINKSIEIFILNINDCQPSFNQTNFTFEITENNHFPFLLYTFQAFDQDYQDQIIYSIQTSDENTFSINSTNGEFNILKSFDREIQSNYSLFICAFDQIYKTCSTININILDQNDNICKFNSSSITLNINENLPSNTFLIQIKAYDSDYDTNSKLIYKFSSKTSYLYINSTTACDNINSFPSLCCYLQLFINIIDLDDNLPYLIYPLLNNNKNLFIINYTNKIMPRLKALDNDIQIQNRFIFYSIIGGSLNSSINIDYLSGQLFLLSTSKLPIYGTLIISLSSKTIIHLTILIHDNQTDPQQFLMSINPSSSELFYFISFISIGIIIFLLGIILLLFYFCKQKHDDDPLMNTPSTTTLSARSISTSTNKKIYDTYYSFGDSVCPEVIHV